MVIPPHFPLTFSPHTSPHIYPTLSPHFSSRFNHSAVYDEDNHRLVIFGGRSAERKRLNDVWFLDLEKWCAGGGGGMEVWGEHARVERKASAGAWSDSSSILGEGGWPGGEYR